MHPHQLPPFLGVTLSVKDVTDVAGLPTTHSCKALVDNVAAADDPVVHRFRHAGFVVLGKTNVPEFCTTMTSSELNGICRNPWDRDRTPGGSSGGAAAALSAGLCAVSHGTDGAGSVRSPASFCGVVGVKPTRDTRRSDPITGTRTSARRRTACSPGRCVTPPTCSTWSRTRYSNTNGGRRGPSAPTRTRWEWIPGGSGSR